MNHFWLGVLVLNVVVTVVVKADDGDVHIECGNGTIRVTWRTAQDVEFNRVFLGSCFAFPYDVTDLPDGRMEIAFRVHFHQCRIKRQIMGKWVTFSTKLTYRPLPKGQPPVFTYPVECMYRRPKDWFKGFPGAGFGTAIGRGSLLFYMGIANGDFSGPAQSSTFYLGSLIPVWAAVDQQDHLPLLLLMDECVATTTPEPDPSGPVYPIISNGGCLLDSKIGSSRFLPRRQSSELNLLLQAFQFAVGQEVYLHCTVVAWDPLALDKSRKACHYSKELEGWELLDDPSDNSLCSCCDSRCKYRDRRSLDLGVQGVGHTATVGPFTIINGSPSESGKRPVPERVIQSLLFQVTYLLQVSPSWAGWGQVALRLTAVLIQQRALKFS
ncbi:hypothetical protein COCON_G00138400 [Conger conger]|uniref:ZP domain-containing protein n=1 Tax=Conger conger TaxID=82655 RepID=A0A9Q1DFD2_CONCO|nr:hypothetical protein COCON_G00138400 [Conger conger]